MKIFYRFPIGDYSTSNRIIPWKPKDNINKVSWFETVVKTVVNGYLQQHFRKRLWKQITHLPNTENDPRIIIKDLNELPNPNEKILKQKRVTLLGMIISITLFKENLIDLAYIINPFTWYNKRKAEDAMLHLLIINGLNHVLMQL